MSKICTSKSKIYVEHVLYKFYVIVREDVDTGECEDTDLDFADGLDDDKYYYRAEDMLGSNVFFSKTDINLSLCFHRINSVMIKYQTAYEKIIFRTHDYYPRIVGIRVETDEEFEERMRQIEQQKHNSLEEKKIKKEKSKENKKKLYEKLKKEFEGD